METNELGHEILRQEGQFQLCKDNSDSVPVFYVENTILLKHTKGKGRSYSFDADKADSFLLFDRSRFVELSKRNAGNDINCEEVAKSLWNEFKAIPTNEDDEITKNFFSHTNIMFGSGTDRKDIIEWFEMVFTIPVMRELQS